MNHQEYKVEGDNGVSVFFFRHSGYSALHWAKKYMSNSSTPGAKLYRLNHRPRPFPKWVAV